MAKVSTRLVALSGFVLSGLLAASPLASAGTAPAGVAAPASPLCTQKSTLAGTHLSDKQIAQYARNNGGLHGNGLVISIAVALAESQGWTKAVLINTDCSRDRGVWQINSKWHSEVSDDQAFNPVTCAQQTARISSNGTDWTPWTTYQNGAYNQFMSRARTAASQVGG